MRDGCEHEREDTTVGSTLLLDLSDRIVLGELPADQGDGAPVPEDIVLVVDEVVGEVVVEGGGVQGSQPAFLDAEDVASCQQACHTGQNSDLPQSSFGVGAVQRQGARVPSLDLGMWDLSRRYPRKVKPPQGTSKGRHLIVVPSLPQASVISVLLFRVLLEH